MLIDDDRCNVCDAVVVGCWLIDCGLCVRKSDSVVLIGLDS